MTPDKAKEYDPNRGKILEPAEQLRHLEKVLQADPGQQERPRRETKRVDKRLLRLLSCVSRVCHRLAEQLSRYQQAKTGIQQPCSEAAPRAGAAIAAVQTEWAGTPPNRVRQWLERTTRGFVFAT